MGKYKIETLTIKSDKEFTFNELSFLKALHTTVNFFNKTEKEISSLQMYINQNTFLIASYDINETLNPIAFIDEKGNILFDVDISVFDKEIDVFKHNYLDYYKDRNLTKEEIAKKAIIDYKNDKLDFYTDTNIDLSELITKARNQYNDTVSFE